MSKLSAEQQQILQNDEQQRLRYLLKRAASEQQLWILCDEHGAVMLQSEEDEDCVPVWPEQAFAQSWAVEDWSDCQPKAVSLKEWYQRWTQGLEGDDLAVAVFPSDEESGLVLYPDEFEQALREACK